MANNLDFEESGEETSRKVVGIQDLFLVITVKFIFVHSKFLHPNKSQKSLTLKTIDKNVATSHLRFIDKWRKLNIGTWQRVSVSSSFAGFSNIRPDFLFWNTSFLNMKRTRKELSMRIGKKSGTNFNKLIESIWGNTYTSYVNVFEDICRENVSLSQFLSCLFKFKIFPIIVFPY